MGETAVVANPSAPGLLLALAVVFMGSAVAEAGSCRRAGPWWAVPVLVPVAVGAILAFTAWQTLPAGLSGTVAIVMGMTAAACLGLLQATYTTILWTLRRGGDPP
jgi:hypothetical protein